MENKSIVALSTNVNLLRAFRDELVAAGVPEDKDWNMYIDGDSPYPIEAIVYKYSGKLLQFHNHNTNVQIRYNLPQDWSEAFEAIVAAHSEVNQENTYKIKVGDTLSESMLNHPDTLQYGDGDRGTDGKWKQARAVDDIFYGSRKVEEIKFIAGKWAAKVSDCNNWWVALESVEAYQNLIVNIGEWEAKIFEDVIEVGCQTIEKAEIEAMYRMTKSPINAKIEIHGTEITEELLEKILERMQWR